MHAASLVTQNCAAASTAEGCSGEATAAGLLNEGPPIRRQHGGPASSGLSCRDAPHDMLGLPSEWTLILALAGRVASVVPTTMRDRPSPK